MTTPTSTAAVTIWTRKSDALVLLLNKSCGMSWLIEMNCPVDDSFWPDGEILTEYVLCKTVYQINPEKAATLYPKAFVEKLDELIAKRRIDAPSLRDLVQSFRKRKASGRDLQESNQFLPSFYPIIPDEYEFASKAMVLKDNHYLRNSQNSQRLSKGLFTSQKKGSLEDMLRMPNLRTKLEARSPQKLSTKTVLTNIDDEIENLLSAEPPKRSIRKVWFSPVECKRRRSSWNPAAVPTKSLLKKVTKRSEASQSLKEGTLGNTTSTEKMATTDKVISVISNEDVLPDTQETISEAARDSSEIRESFGKRSLVGTHEESMETLLQGKRKRLGRTKANEEWSDQLRNATSSVDSSNEREERFKKNFPEKDRVYQNGEISASTSVEHAVTPQDLRRQSEAGGRSNGEGICASSKSALNTHNILDRGASEEDVKQHDVSDITNLEPEASTISSNMRSRSAKSASPIIQHSLETRVSRRKRKMVIPDSNDVESHGNMLNQKVLRDLVTEGDTCVRPVENRRCSKRLSLERNDGNNLENFDKLECPLCPKRYAVAKSLRAHVVKVHRDVVEDTREDLQNSDVHEDPNVSSGLCLA
ncbi:hypothetical protein RB195_004412 [Necator americanus]|uniref:C2H2-type domain-containing protein n=2 Tax=Necator americanus TaxID=51031 RepID=A0ABR1BLY4_NECAM